MFMKKAKHAFWVFLATGVPSDSLQNVERFCPNLSGLEGFSFVRAVTCSQKWHPDTAMAGAALGSTTQGASLQGPKEQLPSTVAGAQRTGCRLGRVYHSF